LLTTIALKSKDIYPLLLTAHTLSFSLSLSLLCAHNLCCSQLLFITVGTSDKLVDAIDLLKERAEDDDPNALFALVNDLSKVIMTC